MNAVFIVMLEPTFGREASRMAASNVKWSLPQLLSTSQENGAFIPVITADSDGRIVAVYNQVTDQGVENPYYRESLNGGGSWSEAIAIQVSDEALKQVTVEFDSNNVAHAIWRTQNEIWHSREDQWPYVKNLVTTTVELISDPDIAISDDDTLHIVWSQDNRQVYYIESDDAGSSWTGGRALSTDQGISYRPAVATDSVGNVHVVWETRVASSTMITHEVHYVQGVSEPLGIRWDITSTLLSADLAKAELPDVAAQGDQVHVTFARRDSKDEQFAYYISSAAGSGWGSPLNISHDPLIVNDSVPHVLTPVLVPCDDGVYVYYHGALVTNGKELILGSNNYDNWELVDQVDVGNARAIRPSATCVKGRLHLVYEKVIEPNNYHQVFYMSGNRYSTYLPVIYR